MVIAENKVFSKLPIITVGLLLCLTIFFTKPAFAHTGLESSTPKAGAEITEPLQEITLTFEGKLENLSTFKLFDSHKQEIKANVTLKEKLMTGKLSQPLSNGSYEVQWTIVGEDGHPIQGKYTFTVKNAADKQPQPEVTVTPAASATVEPSTSPSSTPIPVKVSESKAATSNNYWIWIAVGVILIALVVLSVTRRKK
ncbi:copper resistance protein CopC [Paenibacillus sp. CGMCC 1.16610]|uniref:CopC domain-containing protein n=1 Tax=Paenibacillus anseongense TaxID=2682845 RepID=A0ABW9U1V0_9BACL|nr:MULTISPECIES: copper resistance protein CopC [Paenibacillus]MBA2937091.1 copper resistance protein CopC [Paenibacillus sp. CGMCC 1.16610]MVQ33413.1 hypothetical protein [Paenibacillus anseongense]